jgi:hypothetical protein
VGQHALVVGQLQVEQGLIEALAARPAEDGQGHEQLADGCIGGQAPAQATGVQDKLAALAEPSGERLPGGGCPPGFGQEIGGATTGAQGLAGRIGGSEPFGPVPAFQRLELADHARRQGQQVLNGNFGAWHSCGRKHGREPRGLSRGFAGEGGGHSCSAL